MSGSLATLFQEMLGYNTSSGIGSTSIIQVYKLAGCEHNPVTNEITGGLSFWKTRLQRLFLLFTFMVVLLLFS